MPGSGQVDVELVKGFRLGGVRWGPFLGRCVF